MKTVAPTIVGSMVQSNHDELDGPCHEKTAFGAKNPV